MIVVSNNIRCISHFNIWLLFTRRHHLFCALHAVLTLAWYLLVIVC